MRGFNYFRQFYSGKRVFITGHTGFVGAWMTFLLSKIGAEITGYSLNPPSKPYLYNMLEFNGGVKNIKGDIRNFSKLKNEINNADPEIIIHLAAQPILLESYNIPRETYETNVMGTINVLESALGSNVKSIVNVTSDKCYENKLQKKGYIEGDALGGYDPYSSSKACSEIVTRAYSNSFLSKRRIGVSTARAGNIIGGGDWGIKRLMPYLITSLLHNREFKIRNPNAIRPWQYIIDVICGYLMLAERLYVNPHKYSGAYNFGPPLESKITVKTLATKVCDSFDKTAKIKEVKMGMHEDQVLMLNSRKAQSMLGWKPKIHIDNAIKLTVDWYRKYYDGYDINAYSNELVCNYFR